MNPYYYRALMQAKKCHKNNIKISDSFINKYQGELKENLKRLNSFINYANTEDAHRYWNIFEILNAGETSITEFLKLIFDEQKISEQYGKKQLHT